MKRLSVIAMFAAALALAATGCKKKEEGKKPATTETAKPAAGSNAVAPTPTAVDPTPTAGMTPPATGTEPAAGMTPPAAGMDPAVAKEPTTDKPVISDAEFDGMMTKTLAMFDSISKAIDSGAGDCGKVADGLSKVMDVNKDFVKSTERYRNSPEVEQKAKTYMAGHTEQLMGMMGKMQEVSGKCASDPKFTAAMEKFKSMN